MSLSPTVWANRFDPTAASVLLRDGPILRASFQGRPWSSRAIDTDGLMHRYIEAVAGTTGVPKLVAAFPTAGHFLRGTDFAIAVDGAVRKARGTLTVALLNLGRDGAETLTATCASSAAVLLFSAEPGLQAEARAWIAGGRRRVTELVRPGQFGIGAALLSAHMSGPAFPEDILPGIAGDLLTEVAR